MKKADDPIRYYVTNEDMFNRIHQVHLAINHGGEKMREHIKVKYFNITAVALKIYISKCLECEQGRNRASTRSVVVRPLRTHAFKEFPS